jgi:hypothetical protein
MNGPQYKSVEGLVLATDPEQQFSDLEKFGQVRDPYHHLLKKGNAMNAIVQGFLEKFQGIEMPYPILDMVTFIDTPGIIENRKQQARGYPFDQVMAWFIERASLICVVFDPSKLDVGHELESLFQQLKGSESKIRIILNKADSISTQELMRVYGALFWNLAPLINVIEPPRVYIGSFWARKCNVKTNCDLFFQEEISLLQDINQVIANQVENKVAFIRQHAYLVRIHALVVDKYVNAYKEHTSIFSDSVELLNEIVTNPDKYRIFQSVQTDKAISKFDMPPPDHYRTFFRRHALNTFNRNSYYCTLLAGCPMDTLQHAISAQLPALLKQFKEKISQCTSKDCS